MAFPPPSQDQIQNIYQPKDAVGAAIQATGITAAGGTFLAAIQNTMARQNVGAMGAFSRFGTTIAVYAAMGGAYEFTKNASANLRQRDDAWNPAIGGGFAGMMLGLSCMTDCRDGYSDIRSAPAVVGYGAGLSAILYAFSYTGGTLNGYQRDPEVDEVSRKEYLRKNRRRPVEDTVNEIGEGRGVYGPGYEERRAQRIKDAYGIDVPRRGVEAAP
ncbi:hypothetical protein BAUCODRAFT_572453 [Baudoinia panamericana UAMH 10762]|uniref:NADH-ubiquinone oxidoreductase subunit B14.7 n=1 Tax=Baudoinia panamericana (strain UAMH 10762) TaxID=717646 RepID=M2N7W0_BAUPA|nr:uncharacterized protein BAUCODRAFT_572453 [Baudoinia panamericana UAMH 10762]EMD00194.1 hypothetical protein BAUCODRAFT_572453 [Baudoinia panamericana UAMH 10762]